MINFDDGKHTNLLIIYKTFKRVIIQISYTTPDRYSKFRNLLTFQLNLFIQMGDTTRDRCEVYKCVDDGDGFVILLEERVNCPTFDAENCLKMGVSNC